MDANQNPPSERDWTIEEQEAYFSSVDAITGIPNSNMAGAVANNAPMSNTKFTLESVKDIAKRYELWDTKPKTLAVHPMLYPLIVNRCGSAKIEELMFDVGRIKIVQDPYIPLTQTVRKRRWLPKSNRKHVYTPKKYRMVEVYVLGWWIDEKGMSPTRGLK